MAEERVLSTSSSFTSVSRHPFNEATPLAPDPPDITSLKPHPTSGDSPLHTKSYDTFHKTTNRWPAQRQRQPPCYQILPLPLPPLPSWGGYRYGRPYGMHHVLGFPICSDAYVLIFPPFKANGGHSRHPSAHEPPFLILVKFLTRDGVKVNRPRPGSALLYFRLPATLLGRGKTHLGRLCSSVASRASIISGAIGLPTASIDVGVQGMDSPRYRPATTRNTHLEEPSDSVEGNATSANPANDSTTPIGDPRDESPAPPTVNPRAPSIPPSSRVHARSLFIAGSGPLSMKG